MERALITGGTGFVGKHLLSLLRSRGTQVAVLARGPCKQSLDVACYETDVRDRDKVHSAIQDFRPNYIYHLAAVSSPPLSWTFTSLTYEVNVLGTMNVFEAAMSLPAPPRIVNVSTSQVYAPSASALSETSAVSPDNPYAASKLMAELLSVPVRHRVSEGGIITARSFNHTGPGQSCDFVLSSIAKQFAEIEADRRDPKLVLGNIHVKRDFTDVRDVVKAYSLLLEKGSVNEIYNVCSGRARSIKEIVEQFELISGITVEIEMHPGKQRTGEVEEVRGDHSKIRAVTGWEPVIPWKKSLHDLLSYWRASLRHDSRDASANSTEQPRSSPHLISN
jgi:GDP-4-dehydro-6-deoxy-D-mannose reductase